MRVFGKIITLTLLLTLGIMTCGHAQGFRKDHEIRVGVGAFPFSWWGYESDIFDGRYWDDWYRPVIDLEDRDRGGDLYMAGSFFAGYYFQMLKWLQLGVSVSHTRFWRDYSGGKRNSSYTTAMPVVNFTWLNKGIVKLYSGVGVGFDFISEKETGWEDRKLTVDAGFQLTFVGVAVGRRLFGFSEFGMGNHGFFSVGMGYRFKK